MMFPEAVHHLQRALAQPLSPEEQVEATDLLVRSLAAEGKLSEAETAYASLLVDQPHAPAPMDGSPKIQEAFRRAKERVFARGHVELRELPADLPTIRFDVVDPWALVKDVRLRVLEPAGDHLPMPITSHRVEATLPDTTGAAAFVVEARGAQGQVLAQLGSESAPVRRKWIDRSADARPGVGADWPRWAFLGTSVTAAIAGVTFGALAASDSAAAGAAPTALRTQALDERARTRATTANVLFGASALAAGGAVLTWGW